MWSGLTFIKNRLILLWRFIKLSFYAKKVEKAWQEVQQREFDQFFLFQIKQGDGQLEYIYRKGIVDGIRWALSKADNL